MVEAVVEVGRRWDEVVPVLAVVVQANGDVVEDGVDQG